MGPNSTAEFAPTGRGPYVAHLKIRARQRKVVTVCDSQKAIDDDAARYSIGRLSGTHI